MQNFNLTLNRIEKLTAGEYIKLYQDLPGNIQSVIFKMPRLGIDKHFGKFEVVFNE